MEIRPAVVFDTGYLEITEGSSSGGAARRAFVRKTYEVGPVDKMKLIFHQDRFGTFSGKLVAESWVTVMESGIMMIGQKNLVRDGYVEHERVMLPAQEEAELSRLTIWPKFNEESRRLIEQMSPEREEWTAMVMKKEPVVYVTVAEGGLSFAMGCEGEVVYAIVYSAMSAEMDDWRGRAHRVTETQDGVLVEATLWHHQVEEDSNLVDYWVIWGMEVNIKRDREQLEILRERHVEGKIFGMEEIAGVVKPILRVARLENYLP